MTRFRFFNPGHFHAALVLRESSPRIDNSIVVYCDPGPELEAFINLVNSFNMRDHDPTHWQIEVRPGDLNTLVDDPEADVVVLAGRNHKKLETISPLVNAGKHVFADKPWLTNSDQTGLLEAALDGPGFVMDIMTIRHEILSRLCHEIVHSDDVFGGFADSSVERPAIALESIHHLYKLVGGKPLRRPAWYFDCAQQGDGIVDIQSHMIEQAMWFVVDDAAVSPTDVQLFSAHRWPTPVDKDLFSQITGSAEYPFSIAGDVDPDGVLQYPCNGEIVWSLNGVVIQQRAQWRDREPEGAGDMHRLILHGKAGDIHVEQGPQTDFQAQVTLKPAFTPARPGNLEALLTNAREALPRWQQRFPGLSLSCESDGLRFHAPAILDSGHESHFPLVRDRFLDLIDQPAEHPPLYSRIKSRYGLIAQARTLALSGANQ